MKHVNWQMKESFVFPVELGQPTSADEIKVTPRFTEETVEGRPKLTGIYHLAVTVELEEAKAEQLEAGEAIVIDDLDLTGSSGYFEYALPFNIDFPPEAEDPVTVEALNPSYEVKDQQLSIIWEVACTYEEEGIKKQNERAAEEAEAKEEIEEQVEVHEEQEPPSKTARVAVESVATSEGDEVLDFIAELEDGVSATSFRLNDVFV